MLALILALLVLPRSSAGLGTVPNRIHSDGHQPRALLRIALKQGGDEFIPINLCSGPGQLYKEAGLLIGATLNATGVHGD